MPIFHTTQWSRILQLGSDRAEERARALARLCEIYWQPVYWHIVRKTGAPDRAVDTTQDFFAYIIDKDSMALADRSRGRFRTFLLTLADRFLVNEWHAGNRQKRGGGRIFVPLDPSRDDATLPNAPGDDPEAAFDREWALAVVNRARDRVLADYRKRNRTELAEAMLPHVLDVDHDYTPLAASLGMSVANIRVASHRIRRRFGDSIRAVVLETVADPNEVDEELRYLVDVIARS